MSESGLYLRDELYQHAREDPNFLDFLLRSALDGVWYWDLEHPEFEWMSPEFWELLGHDPASKRHLAREWQDLIFPEDLALAQHNFELHLADPDHPYDQVVRYTHKLGHTIWVRCRGIAHRDPLTGKPLRMLGAHTDLTKLVGTQEMLAIMRVQIETMKMQIEAKVMQTEILERRILELERELAASRSADSCPDD